MKRALAVAAAAGVALLLWSVWDRELVTDWMRDARPLPFFAALAVLPALGVPLTPFFVLAGAAFGMRAGLLGSLLALGFNLALCYWIASTRLRAALVWLLRRFDYALPDFRGGGRDAARFTIVVKLAPGVPGFVKNYALGVTGVPFSMYFVTSMLFTGLYAGALVVLGESLFEHDIQTLVLAGGALVVAALAVVLLRRWRVRRNGAGPARRAARAT